MKDAGESVPAGAFIEVQNTNSGISNSAALKHVGLAFGGIKGGCVAMMIEVLSGVLSNGNFGANSETVGPGGELQGPSHFVLAVDPASFGVSPDEFASNMKKYTSDVKAPTTVDTYPGERSDRIKRDRALNGIALNESLVRELNGLAQNKGVSLPWVCEATN